MFLYSSISTGIKAAASASGAGWRTSVYYFLFFNFNFFIFFYILLYLQVLKQQRGLLEQAGARATSSPPGQAQRGGVGVVQRLPLSVPDFSALRCVCSHA